LRYGVSISDACLGWEATERMLRWGREALSKARHRQETSAGKV
jgi:phospho-2-dehydro-3-deoxyheptonate aldolase